ncbi:MAG: G5 domain-containing protein [Clostridiaceae bacterium]|nr:G5 domain-containing protein [Clostridiaceae bacterium]
MNKWFFRTIGLIIVAAMAAAVSILPDSQLLLAVDQTRIPAYVVITSPEGTTNQITFADTLVKAVDEAGIALGEYDLLSLPDETALEPGHEYAVTITRRSRVTLTWSGFELDTSSEVISMGDLMSRSGFSDLDLSDGSRIEQNKTDSAVVDGGEIAYVNVDKKEVRTYETIPFSTVYIDDATLYEGKTAVKTEGQNGQRALVFEETYENGVFISSVQVRTEIITEPVQQVIRKGTKKKIVIAAINARTANSKVVSSFNKIKDLLIKNGNANYQAFADNGNGTITVDGRTFEYIEVKKRTITMYDGLECCLQKGCHTPAINHNTASGISAQRGLVATYGYRENGKVIGTALPLGATIFIEGYGLAVVADVHGVSSNPNLIDACYDAGEINSGAVTWGKRYKRVYILSLP